MKVDKATGKDNTIEALFNGGDYDSFLEDGIDVVFEDVNSTTVSVVISIPFTSW